MMEWLSPLTLFTQGFDPSEQRRAGSTDVVTHRSPCSETFPLRDLPLTAVSGERSINAKSQAQSFYQPETDR